MYRPIQSEDRIGIGRSINRTFRPPLRLRNPELEFLKSLWGLGTWEEEGYRTGPPGNIGWRNSFLGIDAGVPYTFKNTGSGNFACLCSLAESIPGLLKRFKIWALTRFFLPITRLKIPAQNWLHFHLPDRRHSLPILLISLSFLCVAGRGTLLQ